MIFVKTWTWTGSPVTHAVRKMCNLHWNTDNKLPQHNMIKQFFSTAQISKSIVPGVAKSLREASQLDTIAKLELNSSESFVCKNMMCEHLGNSCGKTCAILYCNKHKHSLFLVGLDRQHFDTNTTVSFAHWSPFCVAFLCSFFFNSLSSSTVVDPKSTETDDFNLPQSIQQWTYKIAGRSVWTAQSGTFRPFQ